jgi:bifunctional ADP-heptose synthase (sugar kinase/adenylyltransferase)
MIFDEVDPHNIISYLKPDVLVKGGTISWREK